MVVLHYCCFCRQIILPDEPFVFLEGRGLYAHTPCQQEATDDFRCRPVTTSEPPPPPSAGSAAGDNLRRLVRNAAA